MKLIELKEKQIGETEITLIAECNLYNSDNVLIQQLSRSPFTFSSSMTDEEIILYLQNNEYSIYF